MTGSRTARRPAVRGTSGAQERQLVGVISDTHGLLRPEAVLALRGVGMIVHAGDVGAAEVLAGLGRLAPVLAVRGNVDHGGWAEELPEQRIVEVGEARLLVVHDLEALDIDPATRGFDGLICGHSHVPDIESSGGFLLLNPGSAGPRRFRLPVTLARLEVRGRGLRAEIVALTP